MPGFTPLRCSSCGTFVDWREGAPGEPMPCPECGGTIHVPLDPPGHPNPWEGREGFFLKRWWRTCDRALYHPHVFFARIPWRGGHSAPIRFVVAFYLQFFLILGVWIPVSWALKGKAPFPPSLFLFVALGAPLVCGLATALLYLVSFLVHLCLRAAGGKGPFEATLRVHAYTFPLLIFRYVPWVGPFLHPLWTVACQTFGFAAAHRIAKKRALVGALLGAALAFGILAGLGYLFLVVGLVVLKGSLELMAPAPPPGP